MGYVNPIYHYGMARFVDRAAAVGAQGLICPDLPADEASVLINAARRRNFSTIFLVTPVTTKERLVSIARVSSGFIYYVSLTGTTGLRAAVAHDLARNIARIRTLTRTPVCAGFGISNPRHAREASRAADGVIVGSALIRAIAAHKNERLSLNAFKRALRSFSRAVKKG